MVTDASACLSFKNCSAAHPSTPAPMLHQDLGQEEDPTFCKLAVEMHCCVISWLRASILGDWEDGTTGLMYLPLNHLCCGLCAPAQAWQHNVNCAHLSSNAVRNDLVLMHDGVRRIVFLMTSPFTQLHNLQHGMMRENPITKIVSCLHQSSFSGFPRIMSC